MSTDLENARDDLAFMRALAETPEHPSGDMGLALFWAGIIYGFQALVQWAVAAGFFALPGPYYLAFVIACSVAFFGVLGLIIWRNRNKPTKTVVGRAYESAFQAAGLANLFIVLVFVAATIRENDYGFWNYYAPIIFALQGGAWFVFFRLRKRAWLGLVGAGWFIGSVGLALSAHTSTYVLVIAVSLIILLAGPGLVMMQLAKREAG